MTKKKAALILIFGVLNFVGLALGSMATGPGVASDWYAGLAKAPWTPPGWVFGAAWTTVMLGFTWFMAAAWHQLARGRGRQRWAVMFAAAWLLNVAWNPIFFGWQETEMALVEILALFATIALMAARAWPALGAAKWGIAPYLMWLTVAVSLNAYVVFQNGNPTDGPWPRGRWEADWERLDGAIQWSVEAGEIPGAVLLITRDGQVAVNEAYGMSDPMSGRPMRKDDLFRICSQSKALTATAALVLWERGQLGLDDPVAQYLPEFAAMGVLDSLHSDGTFTSQPTAAQMTVRHLMTHTCGIPYGEIGDPRFAALYEKYDVLDLFPVDGRSTRDNARNIASTCLIHQPGNQWNYSLGLDVLVAVIEEASGQPYVGFLQEAVLGPLGMNDTYFVVPEAARDRLVAVSEPGDQQGEWVAHKHHRYTTDYPLRPEWPLCNGGVGMTSTASDYAQFLQCYLDRGMAGGTRLLEEATIDSAMSDQAPGLLEGAGWHQGLVCGVRTGGDAAGSFFWSGYFNTIHYADPETNTAVVLLKQTYDVRQDSSASAFAAMLWN